jgi:hypothetical protein
MSFETNSKYENLKTEICEATHCENRVAEKIAISAGRYGTIDILVCKSCISKFKEEDDYD